MLILALESSAKAASVALCRDGVLIAQSQQCSGLTHSCTLLPMAEQMLKNTDTRLADVDAIAVARGPGSFTGVRIGVSTAKGLAWGAQKPAIGVSTLEAMTRGAAYADGIYCACMDARKQQIYNTVFSLQAGKLTRLTDDRAIAIDALVPELSEGAGPIYLLGDGAKLASDTLAGSGLPLILLPEQLRQQRASGVALCAMDRMLAGDPGDAAALTPNYLRMAQAERTRQNNQDFYLKK